MNEELLKELEFLRRSVFQVTNLNPSIVNVKDKSEDTIKSTKEYNYYGQEVHSKLRNNEIDDKEADRLLDIKFKELRKEVKLDKPKRKTRRRKLVDRDTEVLKLGRKHEIDYHINEIEDTRLFNHNNIIVKLPSQNILNDNAKSLKYMYGNKFYNTVYYCFVSLTLSGPNIFGGTTRKVPILTTKGDINERCQEVLDNELRKVIERVPFYEDKDAEIICSKIFITITVGKWESIENWYNEPKNQRKYKKFKDFVLFLAPNKNINCMQQCVEELGGKWNQELKFEDMIPQKNIITYIPILMDIQYVNSMEDLIADYNEEMSNNDCTNIARLIKWNGHIGVIKSIKINNKNGKIQSRKMINSLGDNKKELFIDIESFSNNEKKQVPYLICWCDIDGKLDKRSGINCIEQFCDHLISLKTDLILYAWFGSGYDYQHILPFFKKKCIKDKYIIKNNMITYGELEFEYSKIILKDPFLFILTSLDRASKAFNVINKGSFPHTIIHNWEDLEKVLPNWVNSQRRMIEIKNDNKLDIKIENWFTYEDETNYKTILQKAVEYCDIDVLAMKEVWVKFKNLLEKNLEVGIDEKTFTLSQLSMKIMEASLDKKVNLYVPNLKEYGFIKNSIYGGRVIAKNGIYREDIVYADVVSLYPSAMKLLKHSYGKPKIVTSIDSSKHGIYDVTLVHKCDKEPYNYLEFVPRRTDKKLKWSWFKKHRGTYHTYDLLIAKEEGYEIECHKGIEYPEKDYIFNNFINKLYSMKDEHTNCKCKEQPCPIRMVAKIALNGGGYGKFVQKPIDKEIYIVKRDIIAGECEKLETNEFGEVCIGNRIVQKPSFYNLDGIEYDKMIIEKEDEPAYSTQCGVSILSGSRYRLYKLCKEFPGLQVIYSDTDSIFVRKNSINWEKFKKRCGNNLGELDSTIDDTKNAIIDYMLIGGPKMYAFEYIDNKGARKTKLHSKGVPSYMLSMNQFEYLLEGPSKKLAYYFEIIRRRLIGVDTSNIMKDIRQT
uniref:DNA polymerase n=2 Tax=cellular organisms TaxID=131567 RepID=A0A219YH69_DEBHN|nr:hypothetical protein [Debaryomyces hansenii]APZ80133.1 hypothetical protein [Debaryomyces hansenii]